MIGNTKGSIFISFIVLLRVTLQSEFYNICTYAKVPCGFLCVV